MTSFIVRLKDGRDGSGDCVVVTGSVDPRHFADCGSVVAVAWDWLV